MKKIFLYTLATSLLMVACSKNETTENLTETTDSIETTNSTIASKSVPPAPPMTRIDSNEPFSIPTYNAITEDTGRWYTDRMVNNGAIIFQDYCGACHKKDASGAKNWKEKPKRGAFHTPPLNGDAHAWHHPLHVLHQTIKGGTVIYKGNMPAWESILNDEEIYESISFFQSKWSDDTYNAWLQRNGG